MNKENLTEAAPGLSDEPQAGCEIASGISIERRFFLSSLAAAALFVGMPEKFLARDTKFVRNKSLSKEADLSWEDFLAQGVPLAEQMLGDAVSEQDTYLYRIASLAARLKNAPPTKLYPFGGLEPAVAFAPSYKGPPFAVIQWRMEPGAVLPAHNHPNYSVCTLGIEGEARLRNFEVVGDAPDFASKKSFLIRETHNQLISPGRVATLSPTRDNIHQFEAGDNGARGIDITTLYGKDVGFSFVEMVRNAKDAKKNIFEAAWIGMNPRK